jgi:hypothetical protein
LISISEPSAHFDFSFGTFRYPPRDGYPRDGYRDAYPRDTRRNDEFERSPNDKFSDKQYPGGTSINSTFPQAAAGDNHMTSRKDDWKSPSKEHWKNTPHKDDWKTPHKALGPHKPLGGPGGPVVFGSSRWDTAHYGGKGWGANTGANGGKGGKLGGKVI